MKLEPEPEPVNQNHRDRPEQRHAGPSVPSSVDSAAPTRGGNWTPDVESKDSVTSFDNAPTSGKKMFMTTETDITVGHLCQWSRAIGASPGVGIRSHMYNLNSRKVVTLFKM